MPALRALYRDLLHVSVGAEGREIIPISRKRRFTVAAPTSDTRSSLTSPSFGKKPRSVLSKVLLFVAAFIGVVFLFDAVGAAVGKQIAKLFEKPITIAQNEGPQQALDERGLTGRVTGEDGKTVLFKAGRDTYTIYNLPSERYAELVSDGSDLQHAALTREGRIFIADLNGAAGLSRSRAPR